MCELTPQRAKKILNRTDSHYLGILRYKADSTYLDTLSTFNQTFASVCFDEAENTDEPRSTG